MRVIGIDVGLDGAVAVLPDGLIYDTPTALVGNGKKQKRQYLPAQMADLLRPYAEDSMVVLEEVHAMPGNGVTAMFGFGKGLGIWLGVIAALRLPVTLVPPQTWKRRLMDGMGKEKEASRLRAQQLFPALAGQLSRKKDEGRAEALLIAEYGRRHLNGQARGE